MPEPIDTSADDTAQRVAPQPFLIRAATVADLAAITAIYRREVLGGTATYEIDPPGEDEMATRHAAVIAAGLPWFVAVDTNNADRNADTDTTAAVLGYAYATPFRTRAAYKWTVENSVYVADGAKGRGVGRALLDRLVADVTARGYRRMIAVIGDNANVASIRLHAAGGFEPVGTYPGIAFKHGRWLDSVHMQRALGDGTSTPPA
jgi:phosphinothricin acetyltransferase